MAAIGKLEDPAACLGVHGSQAEHVLIEVR
jgi:hypothetical protein